MTDSSKPDSVMESTTDAAEWKLEVERVLPLLKVHIRTDNKVNIFKIPLEIIKQNDCDFLLILLFDL